ncbi:lysophospholipid acyltransferase 1-like protein [Tanacetum coccineum]|uniref:Lysophospholipid acyltransferase 1-like protein n=1 Tax=Tanacetum coccineum TaxID=301880 RepID=A0ABQ5GVN3_9ASTR
MFKASALRHMCEYIKAYVINLKRWFVKSEEAEHTENKHEEPTIELEIEHDYKEYESNKDLPNEQSDRRRIHQDCPSPVATCSLPNESSGLCGISGFYNLRFFWSSYDLILDVDVVVAAVVDLEEEIEEGKSVKRKLLYECESQGHPTGICKKQNLNFDVTNVGSSVMTVDNGINEPSVIQHRTHLDPSNMVDSNTVEKDLADRQNVQVHSNVIKDYMQRLSPLGSAMRHYSSATKQLTVRDALNSALSEEMAADSSVFVMGEEVGEYQGAYKITKGLLDKYGPERIVDTPITETGFTGIGVGVAYHGLRPVIEFMLFNFALQMIVIWNPSVICLCGSYLESKMIVIWNPSVRKCVGIVIPNVLYSPEGYTRIAFGLYPDTSDPELVKVNVVKTTPICWEVQDHVYIDGIIYWRSRDMVNEALGLLEYYKVGGMSLCDVWMRKDGVNKPFTKIYTVKVEGMLVFSYRVSRFRNNGEVLLQLDDDDFGSQIEVYEPSSGRINSVGISGKRYTYEFSPIFILIFIDDNSAVDMNGTMDNLEERITNLEMNDAFHWLEGLNRELKHCKLNMEDHDHPIMKSLKIAHGLHRGRNFLESFDGPINDPILLLMELPHMLHLKGKIFKSCRCFLLVFRDDIGSTEFTIYEMMKGSSVWSVRYLVNIVQLLNPLPKGWSIRTGVWSICLGEGEEDAFMVINLSGKVVKYNQISKTNTEIFYIGSNQIDDDDDDADDDDVILFIPPFKVDPNLMSSFSLLQVCDYRSL